MTGYVGAATSRAHVMRLRGHGWTVQLVADSDEVVLGLGKEPGGLTLEQVHRVITDISTAADVVGLTIAEFIPRDVLVIQGLLEGMPLIPKT